MSRLRSTLSHSPLDRQIQGQVAVAERALLQALMLCAQNRKNDEYTAALLARVRRDLEQALGVLGRVRRVVPGQASWLQDSGVTPKTEPIPEVLPATEAPEEEVE